jgi:hypothetical protein
VFRLDYLSCCLTVLSTILVGRKQWSGLVVGSINCILICAIGWRTAQFGFIPANLFCIGIYGCSIRSWRKPPPPDSAAAERDPELNTPAVNLQAHPWSFEKATNSSRLEKLFESEQQRL